jgi:alanine-synthesizing transaminase
MFSKRLQWSEPQNNLSQRMDELRASGRTIFDLTASNPTRVGLLYPSAITSALAAPEALSYEPTPQGLATAREAIALYYGLSGYNTSSKQLWLTTSTSEAYSLLFKLLADPGDTILIPAPSYPLFSFLAQLESVKLDDYPLFYDGETWRIDTHTLRQKSKGAKAIIIVSPNNPTGSFLHQDELDVLREIGVPIIADEVFRDYLFTPAEDAVSSLSDELIAPGFVLSGFSKVLGLPQMKLGWILPFGSEDFQREAAARLELLLDTYLSVGAPIQHAAPRLLEMSPMLTGQIQERVLENRNCVAILTQKNKNTPVTMLGAEGGWYAVLRVPSVLSEDEWCLRLLEQDAVYVHPGYFFDMEEEAFLVISLLPRPDLFQEGIERLLRRVEREASEQDKKQ